MFEMINEVAVVGITFFMMALYTVWYSSWGFGKWLGSDGTPWGNTEKEARGGIQLLVTTCLFFTALFILAYAVAFIPIISLSTTAFSVAATLFAGVFVAIPAVSENRSRGYVFVHMGFIGVFIIGGIYLITNWPW